MSGILLSDWQFLHEKCQTNYYEYVIKHNQNLRKGNWRYLRSFYFSGFYSLPRKHIIIIISECIFPHSHIRGGTVTFQIYNKRYILLYYTANVCTKLYYFSPESTPRKSLISKDVIHAKGYHLIIRLIFSS